MNSKSNDSSSHDGHDVIDLVDDDDESSDTVGDSENNRPSTTSSILLVAEEDTKKPAARPKPKRKQSVTTIRRNNDKPCLLPTSIVLEDDVTPIVAADDDNVLFVETFYRTKRSDPLLLFQDEEFPPLPSSIRGKHNKATQRPHRPPNCRCGSKTQAKLQYKPDGRPFYTCPNTERRCNYFAWAFVTEQMHWYRFGNHTGHILVSSGSAFAATDLCQGRIGDCWFLSALAVVAERPDLIQRLFRTTPSCITHTDNNSKQHSSLSSSSSYYELNDDGIVRVNLFVDGYWKTVVVDNFLPCIIDSKSEHLLEQAIHASLAGRDVVVGRPTTTTTTTGTVSSRYDRHVLADQCRQTLRDTQEFVQQHQQTTLGTVIPNSIHVKPLRQRVVTSHDLAYSKAKRNQLWVPLLEKAYAKSHGSYSAISGGHIAEAFLDLTGAPTLVYELHSRDFEPQSFWYKLLHYRQQRLPMGCGTDSSAVGIIGMHAYSILDVREVTNVAFSFFQETGVAHGNVSGFTNYDGTVRLLQIRNPHGKGEWKGDFSDRSQIWEKLLQHQQPGNDGKDDDDDDVRNNQGILSRTMKNDGTFWIDYDNFLMGFSNVDVVLAFLGNHAKSIPSNFPAKKSNHRCARSFEVSLIDEQPGLPFADKVELYIMGIQKTRRGASKGRADRKKSYKVCDLGILVGEGVENGHFATVKGEMFGFRRDGHYKLVLDRKRTRRMVVMPVSFGHPAATDKELPFVLRFVSDAPLLIRELPEVPRMDVALQKYCLEAPPSRNQGKRTVLLEDKACRLVQIDSRGNRGGVVLLYLCIREEPNLTPLGRSPVHSFSVEANCRGMSCRTENGLLEHETVAKGKKFEAAWRRYTAEFVGEDRSRLLLVLFQSGQDTEFGSINCKAIPTPRKLGDTCQKQSTLRRFVDANYKTDDYDERGVFNAVAGNDAFHVSSNLGSSIVPREFAGGFQQGMDFELEQALALSRDDHQIADQARIQNDLELQRALEISELEGGRSIASIGKDEESETKRKADSAYDDDLAKVIQISMEESQPSGPAAFVDLTEDVADPPKRKRDDIQDGTVVDLAEKRRLAADAAMQRLNQT